MCIILMQVLFKVAKTEIVICFAGPINREMRNLITSLKNHNEQLKGEVARYKRKLKEAQTEIAKVCQFIF